MKVQFFITPHGDEMAILSRSDYEALIAVHESDPEDTADVAMFDARMAELDDETSTVLPAEVSAFILKGASRLKAVRKWRGLSQQQLAQSADIGQGYLSEIESGRKSGTDETIASIAAALDIPPLWIS